MTVISRLQFNRPGNTMRAGDGWHFRLVLWALIVLYVASKRILAALFGKQKTRHVFKLDKPVNP